LLAKEDSLENHVFLFLLITKKESEVGFSFFENNFYQVIVKYNFRFSSVRKKKVDGIEVRYKHLF
jgi:hypothetical protein